MSDTSLVSRRLPRVGGLQPIRGQANVSSTSDCGLTTRDPRLRLTSDICRAGWRGVLLYRAAGDAGYLDQARNLADTALRPGMPPTRRPPTGATTMPHVRAEPGALLHGLVSTLFPARCVGCGRRGAALCAECRGRLPVLPAEICGRCALPRNGIGPCRACARLSPSLASVRAVCAYEGTARAAVHTLKFRGGRYLAPVMGELLRERLSVWPLHVDVVVPTPLGPGRMRERGYNQAALLAREVVEAAGAAFAESALSREDRHPQQSLTAGQRRRNLAGAVTCVDPGLVVGRRLLVVDDVMTTGTTLAACADALTAAGAVWVGALVFARDL